MYFYMYRYIYNGRRVVKMSKKESKEKTIKEDDSREYIFRPWITKNGKRIYAKNYGIKAFKIYID